MNNQQEYDDIIYLLNYSKDTKIQLYLHQVFRNILKRRSRNTDRIRDAIKFIGILSSKNVNFNFILVLIHELLLNIFKPNGSMLSTIDLTNLLALLSLSIHSYETSCQIISEQIIRQIKQAKIQKIPGSETPIQIFFKVDLASNEVKIMICLRLLQCQ